MEILGILIMIIYAVVGGTSTLVLAVGLPAVLCWKCYRRIRYHIPMTR